MAYGICRIKKLKAGSITLSEQHTKREREIPNADPNIKNIRLIGQPDTGDQNLRTLVLERIGKQTIRKNAVMCVELMLTASPEYFRPENPEMAGYYQPQRLDNFQGTVNKWLSDTYGDRIVRAELHLDESTPHIHAYLVPLDEKGKLNCRGLFGGREKLSKLQDSFALAMEPLDLERGIKGSKARHTEVKKYYTAVNQQPQQTLDMATMHRQLADRREVIKKKKQMEYTAKTLATENEQLKQRIQDLETEKHTQKQQLENWKNKYHSLANKVRSISLEKVAYELGLDPHPQDKHKWINSDHSINITASKFYDWKQLHGGGGAIDLVMHVNQCDFKQSVSWLNDRLGEGAALGATTYYTSEIIQEQPQLQFLPPTLDETKWERVRNYLKLERKLPSPLIDDLHQQGLIYADAKQNLVALRRDLSDETITGASLRGTVGENNTFKGLAPGSKRSQGWFYFTMGGQSTDPIQRAVLVESPIDAISLAVLERTDSRRTIYLSTDGAGHVPVDFLQTFRDKSVIVAYDNDAPGQEMAMEVMNSLPNAVRKEPHTKDWNEDLQLMLDFESQNHQILRQQQQNQEQGYGFSL